MPGTDPAYLFSEVSAKFSMKLKSGEDFSTIWSNLRSQNAGYWSRIPLQWNISRVPWRYFSTLGEENPVAECRVQHDPVVTSDVHPRTLIRCYKMPGHPCPAMVMDSPRSPWRQNKKAYRLVTYTPESEGYSGKWSQMQAGIKSPMSFCVVCRKRCKCSVLRSNFSTKSYQDTVRKIQLTMILKLSRTLKALVSFGLI